MTIWMEVDLKNKELPTGRMADKPGKLAKLVGLKNPKGVSNAISRAKRTGKRCRYVKVVIEEDEDDDSGGTG